jgi:hypothetical protein
VDPEEFLEKMRGIFPAKGYDEENSHGMADNLMCEVLIELGYEKGIEVFKQADKWYS